MPLAGGKSYSHNLQAEYMWHLSEKRNQWKYKTTKLLTAITLYPTADKARICLKNTSAMPLAGGKSYSHNLQAEYVWHLSEKRNQWKYNRPQSSR